MKELNLAVVYIILPECWNCGAQSMIEGEEVDWCTLEVFVACNRPQECNDFWPG